MFTLWVRQGDKQAKVECTHLIPLVLTVKDQMRYYPYAIYEIWDGETQCLYESKRGDRFQRAKAGWRIIRGTKEDNV